jgi:hypothetical protein
MVLTWGSDVSHPDSKENTMYRKSVTSTLNEWKLRFLILTTSYRLTRGRIHDKLYIVLCKSKGGQTMSVKYTTPAQHKSNLRNVYGTFAIEGMTISKDTRRNLDRIGSGQASYQQVVNELRAKYAKKG